MTRKLPPPDFPPSDELIQIVKKAIVDFEGQAPELESAIGMLFFGHAFGWKLVYTIHSIATVRKYERILGIVAKDVFRDTTPLSKRSVAFKFVEKVSNFWKAVKGETMPPEGFRDKSITTG